jgi:hypothetical protein
MNGMILIVPLSKINLLLVSLDHFAENVDRLDPYKA